MTGLRWTEEQFAAWARSNAGTVTVPLPKAGEVVEVLPSPGPGKAWMQLDDGTWRVVDVAESPPVAPERPRTGATSKAAPHYLPDLCRAAGLPVPHAEYRFAPPRRWRFDWCWPEHRVALEIEGGVWTQGRHTRGAGYIKDMAKYNQAAIMGWRILRYTPDQLLNAIADLKQILPDGQTVDVSLLIGNKLLPNKL